MSPGRGLLRLLLVWFGLAVVAVAWPGLEGIWQGVGGLLFVAALASAVVTWRFPLAVEVEREVPSNLPLGEWTDVHLRFHSASHRDLHFEFFDHHPASAEAEAFPQELRLAPGKSKAVTYRIRPRRRGEVHFEQVEIWFRPRFDLWRKRYRLGQPQSLRVVPNYRPVLTQGLAGLSGRMAEHGMHLQRRRGEGLEFQQLRDYRSGDSMRRIDWKATARRGRLISRQYGDERNQHVILLLDCGRRMHATEGDLTHFDHVLNAALLLAYVANRQGDAVGVQAFAGDERWLPPVRGNTALRRLLDVVHDLQTSTESPDFMAAVARLMERQRRRALVLLVTNLRDEDSEEVQPAINMLSQRHLVLVASTRERSLALLRDQKTHSFQAAVDVGAAHHYLAARRRTHEAALRSGAFVLDVEPQALPLALVARYLDIKRAGRL